MTKNKPNNEIIIYTGDGGQPVINVHIDGETVWLTQLQIVDLFDSSKANISEHIKKIFEEEELERNATVRKFRTVAPNSNSPSAYIFLRCSLIVAFYFPITCFVRSYTFQ